MVYKIKIFLNSIPNSITNFIKNSNEYFLMKILF
jgi:hypothetical protein